MLASLNNTGEETIVHASWNGATDVASWRVLAGKQRRPLHGAGDDSRRAASRARPTLPAKYAYAAVQALDASGHVLGDLARPCGDQLRRLAPGPRRVAMRTLVRELSRR